jgi:hypothetical protein
VEIRWKKYGATSSRMPGRIRYCLCRIVGRFLTSPPSDCADRSDTPDVSDAPQEGDLPAYPGIEIPTINVVDER